MIRSRTQSGPARLGLGLLLAALAGGALPGTSLAASGSTGTGSAPIQTNENPGQAIVPQRAIPQTVEIAGIIQNSAGDRLPGIRVKLFSNGVSVESATSGPDGTFSLTANPMAGAQQTTDLWIESPDPEIYLDENVVLMASSAARHLFPECTSTVDLQRNATNIIVTLFSSDEKKDAVRESKCLENAAAH